MTDDELDAIPYNSLLRITGGELKDRLVVLDDLTRESKLKGEVFIGRPFDAAWGIPASQLELATKDMVSSRKEQLADRLKEACETECEWKPKRVQELALDGLEYALLLSEYWKLEERDTPLLHFRKQ